MRSTGPRTAIGKLRSSKNALTHGLTVPVRDDPAWRQKALSLAKILGGDHPHSPAAMACAEDLAQAQMELERIDARRFAIFAHASRAQGGEVAEYVRALTALDRIKRYERRATVRWKVARQKLSDASRA